MHAEFGSRAFQVNKSWIGQVSTRNTNYDYASMGSLALVSSKSCVPCNLPLLNLKDLESTEDNIAISAGIGYHHQPSTC